MGNALQKIFDATYQDKANSDANKQLIPFKVEEYDCLSEFLNENNVPKETTDGTTLSLIGRVCHFANFPAGEHSGNERGEEHYYDPEDSELND